MSKIGEKSLGRHGVEYCACGGVHRLRYVPRDVVGVGGLQRKEVGPMNMGFVDDEGVGVIRKYRRGKCLER